MEFICGSKIVWTILIFFLLTADKDKGSASLIKTINVKGQFRPFVCTQPQSLIDHNPKLQSTDKVSSTIISTEIDEFDQTTVGDKETTTPTTEQTIVNDVITTEPTTMPEKVKSTFISTTTKRSDETTIPDMESTIKTTTPQVITTKATTIPEKLESTLLLTSTKGVDDTTVKDKESTIRTTSPQVITTKATTIPVKLESTLLLTTTKGVDDTTVKDKESTIRTTTPQVITTKATTTTDKIESTPVSTTTRGMDITTLQDKETTVRTTTEDNSVAEVCDTWTVHSSSCYLFVTTDAPTWYDAAEQCASYHPNAHLVFIESNFENEFVATLIGSSPTPWIGLTDEDVEGEWVWSNQGVSTDTPATYVKWDSDYANTNNRNCGYIRGYSKKWQAYRCDTAEVFVCELEQ